MAIEGGCFTMVCSAVISKEGSKIMNIDGLGTTPAAVVSKDNSDRTHRQPIEGGGFTAIYAPDGHKIAQSKDQFSDEIVYADVDLDDIHRHKQMADCIGH